MERSESFGSVPSSINLQHITQSVYDRSSFVGSTVVGAQCLCDPCDCSVDELGTLQEKLSYRDFDVSIETSCPCGIECVCDVPSECPCGIQCVCDVPSECPCGVQCVCDDVPTEETCPCGKSTCECDPNLAKRFQTNLQAPCTCNPCECDCELVAVGEELISNTNVEPPRIDHARLFYEKLGRGLKSQKAELCYETFGKPKRYSLSRDLIRDLLIDEGESGKVSCYLPGNELFPGLLLHRINDKDVCNIRSILLDNRSITSINLAYNNIADVGLRRLAPAIKDCGNIAHLNLMHNNFTEKGLMHLVQALQRRAPLQTLRLTGVKFGDAGIDALTCLILSGRTPLDLDIGECDLSVEGFQTICTAFHSLDHDINYPNFLLARNLPIDLMTLKDMKQEYNDELGHLSRMGEKVTANRFTISNRKEKTLSKWGARQQAKLKNSEKHRIEKSLQIGHDGEIPMIFQEFSATVLQGLFDLRHRLSEVEPPPSLRPTESADVQRLAARLQYSADLVEKAMAITNETEGYGDLYEYIDEYKQLRDRTMDEEDVYAIPIVSPSFYKLDAGTDEHLLSDFAHEIDNPRRYKKSEDARTKMRVYHGQVIDFDESILKQTRDETDAIDEFTANDAGRCAAQEMIKEAAEIVGASDELTEKSDVIQLLFMTLVDSVRKSQDFAETENFNVRECTEMLETAMEKLEGFLMPQIPEQCSVLQEDDVRTFVRTLVETASGTFLGLLRNERVCKVFAQDGSIACRENILLQPGNESGTQLGDVDATMTEDQIRYIAIQFLNGAIEEASRLISTGDPFGFRVQQDCLKKHEATLAHAQEIFDTESNIYGTVDKLMELSGQVAGSAFEDAEDIHKVTGRYNAAANKFIETLLDDVRDTLGDYLQSFEEPEVREETDREAIMKLEYRYVSRPTRLVLNRPFFRHYEELMGAKLGDYMRGNRTIKALHIQKWCLGEDGMLAFMDGLMMNKTVRILDLGCNELAADGMKPLGLYLATNKNLKHLVLNHNHLKDAGILNLLSCITESNIVSLNVAHNDITWIGLDPLLQIIPKTKIHALYLWGNAFGLETWKLFNHLLAKKIIKYSDTLVQAIDDETFCIVKDSQTRETNQYYDVRPILEGLNVPPYMTDAVHSLLYVDDEDENGRE